MSLFFVVGSGVVKLPLKSKNYVSAEGNQLSGTDGIGKKGYVDMLSRLADNVKTGLKGIGGAAKQMLEDDIVISGSVSFLVQFNFPIWERCTPIYPKSLHRRVTVLSGKNLPEVNGIHPSCKVVMLYGGSVVGKSMVIPGSSFPKWQEAYCDIAVDFDSTDPFIVQVPTKNICLLSIK